MTYEEWIIIPQNKEIAELNEYHAKLLYEQDMDRADKVQAAGRASGGGVRKRKVVAAACTTKEYLIDPTNAIDNEWQMYDMTNTMVGPPITDWVGSITLDETAGTGTFNWSSSTTFFGIPWGPFIGTAVLITPSSGVGTPAIWELSYNMTWGTNTFPVVEQLSITEDPANGNITLESVDTEPDGIPGTQFTAGPFVGFSQDWKWKLTGLLCS